MVKIIHHLFHIFNEFMISEDIDLPFENSPFIMIGVASFDVKFGIKVVYQWNFSDSKILNNSEMTVNDIFKINLCNVHHQSEQYFQDFRISKLEYPQQDIYMFFSVFFVNLSPRNTYFSLGIIMKASEIKSNIYFNSFLNSRVRYLTSILKKSILENKPCSSITPHIKNFSFDISQLIFAMNKQNLLEKTILKFNTSEAEHPSKSLVHNPTSKNINKTNSRFLNYNHNFALENDTLYDFSEIEFSFLAILLTSHIQTCMTTIVECQNIKFAHCIAMFLDRFLLPSQREMSSFEVHENPIPGLFLQFVHQQKTLRNKSIINRPTTWVRLSDQTVDQIIPTNHQNNNNSLNNYTYTNLVSIKNPAPWVCKTIQIIQQAPVSMQKKICDIQMKDILSLATSYSIIAQSIPQTQTQLLKPWTWSIFNEKSAGLPSNILGSINLSNEEDFKIIASIARIFDPESIML